MDRRRLVMLATCALALACGERGPRDDVSSDVQRCKEHLRAVHAGLVRLAEGDGTLQGAGPALLRQLITSGVWDDSAESRARLECSGAHAPEHSVYAARDLGAFPLRAFPLGGTPREPIAACSNRGHLCHDGLTNVLYADGSILTLHLDQLIEHGDVPPGTTNLEVGPGSPLADLRKLVAE